MKAVVCFALIVGCGVYALLHFLFWWKHREELRKEFAEGACWSQIVIAVLIAINVLQVWID